MPTAWKTVRVFISSTFRDMRAERDHLVRVVFPELKERCRTKHVQLIDVDLRWGVTEADAENGKALDICLDEIDSCRPYFLGVLGHRYGFVPEGRRHSITAQEIYHGALHGSLPEQVVDLRKVLEERLKGLTLSREQKDCLARCYRWDEDKHKFLLQEVTPKDAGIIRSVFERYPIYQKDRSFFFFRSEALSHQLAGTKTSDFFDEDQKRLDFLKKKIVEAKLPHFEYGDIEAFGQLVLNILWKRIKAETEEAPIEERDWLGQEAELHELFMADRTRRFVGRRDLLDRMHSFCDGTSDRSLLVITGSPGSGKSAMMARFTEEALRYHPDWLVLGHFVGASPSSTSLRQMLRRFCAFLSRATGANEDPPEDIKEVLPLFSELLPKASEQRKLLLVIDAVNQLEQSDHAHTMHWLPKMLPPNVRVVISTLAGDARDAILRRMSTPPELTISGLAAPETRELASVYLRDIRRQFPNPQVAESFYRKVEKGNPLYILVALEELRVFGKFEELGSRISKLPDDVPALFEQVLERIESDFDPALVSDFMSYIACGRHGMTAEELQTMLKSHAPRIGPNLNVPRFPDLLWSRLYRSLGAYLFERSGVIDFFHGQLKEAVGRRYLNEESRRVAVHHEIANHLSSEWQKPSIRALDELPHQLTKAGDWRSLKDILCDLNFIELKCQAGMTYELGADYESALSAGDVPAESLSVVSEFARFVHAKSHVFAKKPQLTFQEAANQPDSSAPSLAAHARMEAGLETRPWFQYVNKPQSRAACLMTLTGHTGGVHFCAFSPDGSRILSASGDMTLKLWDAHTGAELITLAGHQDTVNSCAFSPDGSRIVSASRDGTLRLWDVHTGVELAALVGHENAVCACAFSPDGNRVLSGSYDNTLKLWDYASGTELATLVGHEDSVLACAFSSDGSRIISASNDRTLKLWDAKTTHEIATLSGHTGWVEACAFSPDGSRIISASQDCTLKVWDAKTGAELTTLRGHEDMVEACAFSSDGSRIISASTGRTLILWDAEKGSKVATLLRRHKGEFALWQNAFAFSPDGSRIISSSRNMSLTLWDSRTGAELATLVGHADLVKACAFSPDGNLILSASRDMSLKVWDAKVSTRVGPDTLANRTGTVRMWRNSPDGRRIVSAFEETLKLWDSSSGVELAILAGHTAEVVACTFSPDSSRILSASADRTLKLWESSSGEELATLVGHKDQVSACAFSPDGGRIVSASYKELKLWDTDTGTELATLAGHKGWVNACAFSPDGNLITSAASDTTLKLWDGKAGVELATLTGHTSEVLACTFSPDGNRIVSTADSMDKDPKLWDAATGAELATLTGHEERVSRCAFSPDGGRIVSASFKELKLWDAKTGHELTTISGHLKDEFRIGVKAFAFSPDGTRIVSASNDHALRLWDAKTGRALATLSGHREEVNACEFSQDGWYIVSVSWDKTVKLWDARTGEQIWEYELEANGAGADWSRKDRDLVVISSLGHHLVLRLRSLSLGPVLVTAWASNPHRWIPWSRIHFGCPLCRVWSEADVSALGSVILCPHCRESIKLSPITINADWRPIAAAWRAKGG
jgi:WD40 repeat protein